MSYLANTTKNYEQLVSKLEMFRKKYYQFLFVKGILLYFSFLFVCISIISVVEYFLYLPVLLRGLFVVVFLFFSFFFLFKWVLKPFFKWIGISRSLTNKEFSILIQRHFPEIEDQLINILELAEDEGNINALLQAGIDQKIQNISHYQFTDAIEFKKLRVLFFTFSFAVVLILSVGYFLPGLYKESFSRFIHFQQEFFKPVPYRLILDEDLLTVKRGNPLDLKVFCEGYEVPDILYITISGKNYLMQKENDSTFTYHLDQVFHSFSFIFTDLVYSSKPYFVKTNPNPLLLNYAINIVPPAYTLVKKWSVENVADIKVPYGSQLSWIFELADSDSLRMNFSDTCFYADRREAYFEFEKNVYRNQSYSIDLINSFYANKDVLSFDIEVLPDSYPEIRVVQSRDSTDYCRFYFRGSLIDDYGFHDLKFHITSLEQDTSIVLPLYQYQLEQEFYYTFNFKDINHLGDSFTYFFTVTDNDPFYPFKKACSETFQFHYLSNNELLDSLENHFYTVDQLADSSFVVNIELSRQIEDFKKKIFTEKLSDWEKQQMIREIVDKKNFLDNILDRIKDENSDMMRMNNSFSQTKADLLEKQLQVEKLLGEIMDEELQKLFDELDELATDFDQNRLNDLLNNSHFSVDDFSKQIDRNLEMLKRLKVEQMLEKLIDILHELAKEEMANSARLENRHEIGPVLRSEYDQMQKFKLGMGKMEEIYRTNNELKKPMNLFPIDKEIDDIENKYLDNLNLMEDEKVKKAKEGMEKNAQQIENLSFTLQQMLLNSKMKQQVEDIHFLRQLLDNLIYLSFQLEYVFDNIQPFSVNQSIDSQFSDKLVGLKEQSVIVKDSLFALANRNPAISNKIYSEINQLDFSFDKVFFSIGEVNVGNSLRYLQTGITAVNELGLFLNESLDNLEKQLANSMPGDQQCDKPGGASGLGMKSLKEAQQSLKEQMEELIKRMKEGKIANFEGETGKMLAKQELFKQMVQQLLMDSDIGSAAKEQLKVVQNLVEQNRLDLIQKNVGTSMIHRQNLILDKLLKAEKAEMERGIDEERESERSDEKFFSNPKGYFEYKNLERKDSLYIQYNNYKLRNFYNQKYRDFINLMQVD